MKRKNYHYVVAFLLLFPQSILSQSQVLDDESKYIIVEGDVVDSVKMKSILEEKRVKVNQTLNNLSNYMADLEQLIAIGKVNGKITDEKLYNQAIEVFDAYIRLKDKIKANKNNNQWRNANIRLIEEAERLQYAEGYFNVTLKTNEEKVEKMLKKQKMSELFVPYLEQVLINAKKVAQSTERLGMELSPGETPYKKGLKKILNPYNRNYWYVNDKSYLDTLDFKMQLGQWEWWKNEKGEETYTAYPRSMHYYIYKSHPEYRVIGDKVFNADGKLICQTNLLRGDKEIISHLKEELLKAIYINDFKSNKYDILKASAKTQEEVKNFLGLPFKSSVDAKTAKKNEKIVNDYFTTKADEIKVSNGSWQQRARARARANNAENKMGALLFSAMADKDFNAAYNYKNQLEKDHQYDLYEVYKITRVNNTSFKVIFMNKQNKSSYSGLVSLKQTGKFQWEYDYKLIPNEQSIEINISDYPKTTMYNLNGKIIH